ncbi:MAG: hypothetical protein ACREOM_08420 [Candidatus Dormibacteraceae bacterium]
MDAEPTRRQRSIWAFWLACGVAAVAGILPILLAGTSGRVNGVIVPLWAAAIAFGACAILQGYGRAIVTGVYFVAGLATGYGILSIAAVPLRLAVLGTCTPSPAACAAGAERPLTSAENSGIAFAAALGIIALLVGFVGLATLYRRLNKGQVASRPPMRRILPFASKPSEPPPQPPVRRIPPVTYSSATEPEAIPTPAETPPTAAAAGEPELPAPEPQLELPAPAQELELPAHVDSPPAPGATPSLQAAATRPRRKRRSEPIEEPPPPLPSSDI